MLFIHSLIEDIVLGRKTQTRRPAKSSDHGHLDTVWRGTRKLYCVGQDYAVQPGRGKPCVWYTVFNTTEGPSVRIANDNDGELVWTNARPLRIELTQIRLEDVRNISHDDVLAEGFKTHADFFKVWCGMYDPKALRTEFGKLTVFDVADSLPKDKAMQYLDDWKRLALVKRDDSLYQAWVLDFKVKEID